MSIGMQHSLPTHFKKTSFLRMSNNTAMYNEGIACCKYTLKMEDLQYACHLLENLQIRKSLDELGEMYQICRSGNWRSKAASEKGCQNHKCEHLNNIPML